MNAGTTIERAFELAREGGCASVEDIRRTLSREGFSGVDAHLAGLGLRNQLKVLMRQARAGREQSRNWAIPIAKGEPA